VLGYGYANVDGTRSIATANETAKSSHSGNELTASLQASLGYMLSGWAVSPAAGAKFLSLSQGQFSEKGTDIYNYTVRSDTVNSLRPYIDTSISHHYRIGDHTALVPQLTVGYETDVGATNRNINVLTEGDNYIWRIAGTPQSRGSATVEAGITIETSKSEGIYIDYDRTQSSSTTNQSFTAGLRYRL
jgi:uncharacterized protein with beta-barrel porin domain